MPGVTGVEQEAIRDRAPLTSTRQTRQAPVGVASLRWQSVGMTTPASRAASRIVCPGLKVVSFPLRVKVVLSMGDSSHKIMPELSYMSILTYMIS